MMMGIDDLDSKAREIFGRTLGQRCINTGEGFDCQNGARDKTLG